MRCAFNAFLKGVPQRSHTKQSSYTGWLVGVLCSTKVTVRMEEIGLPSSQTSVAFQEQLVQVSCTLLLERERVHWMLPFCA